MLEAVSGMGEDVLTYIPPPGTKARRSLFLARQKDVPKPRNRQCIGPMPVRLTESLEVFSWTLTKTRQCFVVCPAKLQERNTFSKQPSFSFMVLYMPDQRNKSFKARSMMRFFRFVNMHSTGTVKIGEVPFVWGSYGSFFSFLYNVEFSFSSALFSSLVMDLGWPKFRTQSPQQKCFVIVQNYWMFWLLVWVDVCQVWVILQF